MNARKTERKKKHILLHYLPGNWSLTLQAAIPADKFIPGLGRNKDIVQLIYKVLLQDLGVLVFR